MNLSDFGIYRLDDYRDVEPFFEWLTRVLDSGQTISIDTETGSVFDLYLPRTAPGTGYCRLWQIGTAREGWAIDAREWHGVVDTAMSMVSKARNLVVFANCKFDQHVFHKEGWATVPWHRVEDVVTMHRLTRSFEDSHGLKPACEREFGYWAVQGQTALKRVMAENGWTWDTVPTDCPEYFGYGVMDCCLTVMLYEVLIKEQTWWYEVEMEYLRLTWNMEVRGLLIDLDKLDIAEKMWRDQVEYHAKELKILGFAHPTKNQAVAEAFEALGFEPTEFSEKTGNPTYDKMVLSFMQTLGEPLASAAEHLMAHRRASKWLSVYGTALRNCIYTGDNIVHFSISTQEARTGRSSIKKPGPPLQTFPKHPVPRNTIKARPGHKLWAVDYSSQEIRVQAALSEDPAMMAFFHGEDDDYHQYVATLAGIPRNAAKTVNYARAYGAGLAKLSRSANVSEDEMSVFLEQIDKAFPRAIEWKNEVTALAELRAKDGYPYVDLPYGRRAALVEGTEFTTAANTTIQGHGADVLKLAGSRIARAGLDYSLVLPMHDEYLVELPEDDMTTAYDIARLMEDDFLKVKLTCDVTGPLDRWGEANE